jgi:hypothetical protein
MKLNIFNPWRDFSTVGQTTIQYQTSKKGSVYVTYLRDKETHAPITLGNGRDKESSLKAAQVNLNKIGAEGVRKAIETGQMIMPSFDKPQEKDIDWRDGANHRYRAQTKIVDRDFS